MRCAWRAPRNRLVPVTSVSNLPISRRTSGYRLYHSPTRAPVLSCRHERGSKMHRISMLALAGLLGVTTAFADETPKNSIAVAGEAELVMPPDYADVELGVVTQA